MGEKPRHIWNPAPLPAQSPGEDFANRLLYYPTTTREESPFMGRITDNLTSGKVFADLDLPAMDAANDRAMICGSLAFNTDVKAVLEGFGLHEGVLVGRFIKHPQRLPGFDGVALIHVKRRQPPPDAEAHVHGANINVTVQRQAFILMALIPKPATDSCSKQNNNHQNDGDRFFHDFRLLCVKPCRIRSR